MASQLVARAAATSGAAVAAAGYACFRELASEDDAPLGSTSEGPSRSAPCAVFDARARRGTHPRLRRVLPRRRPSPAPSTPRPRQPPPGTSLASPPPRRRNLAGRERGAVSGRPRGRSRRTRSRTRASNDPATRRASPATCLRHPPPRASPSAEAATPLARASPPPPSTRTTTTRRPFPLGRRPPSRPRPAGASDSADATRAMRRFERAMRRRAPLEHTLWHEDDAGSNPRSGRFATDLSAAAERRSDRHRGVDPSDEFGGEFGDEFGTRLGTNHSPPPPPSRRSGQGGAPPHRARRR